MIFFPNQQDNTDLHVVRAILTDSGHYLLPTDDPDSQAAEEGALADTVIDAFESVVQSLKGLTGRDCSSQSKTSSKRTAASTATAVNHVTDSGPRQEQESVPVGVSNSLQPQASFLGTDIDQAAKLSERDAQLNLKAAKEECEQLLQSLSAYEDASSTGSVSYTHLTLPTNREV